MPVESRSLQRPGSAEDAEEKVSVTYNDPEYLRARHGYPAELTKNLAGAGALIAKAVE